MSLDVLVLRLSTSSATSVPVAPKLWNSSANAKEATLKRESGVTLQDRSKARVQQSFQALPLCELASELSPLGPPLSRELKRAEKSCHSEVRCFAESVLTTMESPRCTFTPEMQEWL